MKTRYVYFDKTTGMITSIVNKRNRGRAPYVVSDNETVGSIVAGTKGLMDLVVAYDRHKQEYVLLDRDNIIRLRYYGDKLYKIPKRHIDNYDLLIEVYKDGAVLEVSLDPTRISTMYSTNMRDEVKFEEGTEIRIYVKSKDGNTQFKTIIINAQQLLETGQMVYDINDIDMNDLSFYTDRGFENYMWSYSKAIFCSPIKDKVEFEVQKADLKQRSDNFEYHLRISESNGLLKIQNNIEDIRLVKIFCDVDFFIVDKYDPTILYEKFVLTPDDFKSPILSMVIGEDMKGKTILYNHRYISVLLEGDTSE